MSKKKKHSPGRPPIGLRQPVDDLVLLVKRANHALDGSDYDRAWTTWAGIARMYPKQLALANRGLGETLFRRSLSRADLQEAIDGLRQATELAPLEAHFHYYLALFLHQSGRPREALEAYKAAHDLGFDPRRLGYVWALAAIEADDQEHQALARPLVADAGEQATLDAVVLLRRKKSVAPQPLERATNRLTRLWIGLAHVARGENEAALAALQAAGDPDAGPDPRQQRPDAAEAVRLYYLGVLAAAANDLETATAHWKAAHAAGLSSLPGNWPSDGLARNLGGLYRQKAAALLEAQRYQEVLSEAQSGLKVAPGDRILSETASLAGFYLGNQAALAGDWKQAQEFWELAHAVHPNRQLALNLGLAYERLERWNEAAEYWREMARRRPRKADHPDYLTDQQVAAVWSRAALCYTRAGNPDESVIAFRSAVKYAPENMEIYVEIARAQVAVGSNSAALNTLERAKTIDPNHVGVLNLMASIYLASGAPWQAVNTWEQVLKIDSDNAEARGALCAYYQRIGDRFLEEWGNLDQAQEFFGKGLAIDPNHAGLFGSMAIVMAHRKNPDAAHDYARRAVEQAGARPEGFYQAARAMIILGEAEAAVAYGQQARQQVLDLAPGFYIDLAFAALAAQQNALFAEFERKAEEMSRDQIEFCMGMATACMARQRLDLAERYLQRVLATDPSYGHAHLILSMICAETGRSKEARAEAKETKRLARKSGDAQLLEMAQALDELISMGMPKGMLSMMLNAFELAEEMDLGGYGNRY